MWDAWAAYDSVATGYVVQGRRTAADLDAERREAISYAAYRVLSHRYAKAVGGGISQACFDAFMAKLGYDPADTDATGTSARAFGNRVGATVIDTFADDGANEGKDYAPPAPYVPDVPTAAEAGLGEFESGTWSGLLAPTGTPQPIIQRLNTETRRAAQAEELRNVMAQQGGEVVTGSPEEFARLIAQESTKWAKALVIAGVKPE